MPTSLNLNLSLRKQKDLLAARLEAEEATLFVRLKLDREVSVVE